MVARMDACAVPFIALLAPAGFRKTEIAAAYAARFQHVRRLELSSGLDDNVWPDTPACIVVDAAEHADDDALRALLVHLLQTRPAEGHLVLCTRREPLTFRFTDLVRPDQLAVFRRADLELTFSEVKARVPSGHKVAYSTLYDIYALTHGWPVPVASLIATHARGALKAGHRNPNDPALYDLLDWVDREVIAVLPRVTQHTLLRCVACPDLAPSDFDEQFIDPNTRPDRRLLRNAQYADLGDGGEIRVQPLIAFAIRARYAEQLTAVGLEEAAWLLERDQPMRAVRTLVCIGEFERAAEIVDEYGFESMRDLAGFAYPALALEQYGEALPTFDRYPSLWLCLLPSRVHVVASVELAREGTRLLQMHGAYLDRQLRCWIRAMVAALLADAGDLAAAERCAVQLGEHESCDDSDVAISLDVARMYVDVARGRSQSAYERWGRVDAYFERSPVWRSFHLRCGARAKVGLGDVRGGIDAMQATLAAVRLGGCPSLSVFGAMYAAVLSWWRADEVDFRRFRREFADLVARYDAPLLWNALSALYGREFDELAPVPEFHDALAAIVLAADCTEVKRREASVDRAISAADLRADLALRIAARFVAAICSVRATDTFLMEAIDLANSLDSTPLQESLAAYRAGGSPIGALQPLVDHVRRAGDDAVAPLVTDTARIVPVRKAEQTLVVDVASGEILRGQEAVKTSEGTSQLLMLLAVYGEANRDVIADAIWPDLEGDGAANALKMCVHRARTQLEESSAIVVSKSLYRLGASVRSTYPEILEVMRAIGGPFAEERRPEYLSLFDRLSKSLAANRLPWEWFVPYARTLADAVRTIGERLGMDALDRGDAQTALEIARRMVGVDPLDEAARELVMRAYRKLGNATAAMREFEEFSDKLRREMSVAPSERLRRLIATP